MSDGKRGGIHKGHRTRLRDEFFHNGFDLFDDSTLLEMLLFYCVPRKNTNRLAHHLISRFGSLHGVLEAGTDELRSFGLSENGALMLKLMYDVMETTYSDPDRHSGRLTADSIESFFLNRYIGNDSDESCILLLDSQCRRLFCNTLECGTVKNSADAEEVVGLAMMYDASGTVIARNKPCSDPIPDRDDIRAAQLINSALALNRLYLTDYLIIADTVCFSMGNSEYGSLFL